MWPFRQKALTGTPEVIEAMRDRQWAPWPLLGGGSRQRIQDAFNTAQSANYAWVYANSPAVRTVVDVIVRNIGQLDLRLYEEISEAERQPRPDHPAALSLRYPNETTPSDSFIRGLVKEFLLYDNAYAVLTPATGRQITLNRVPSHMVEIRGSSLFNAEGYRVWLRDGTYQEFAPENMLHWRGENPTDPRMGLSRLDTLRSVIAEDAALQAAITELANSGMTEPVWAYRPLEAPELSDDVEDRYGEHLTNLIHRSNRRVVVTQEGTELKSFGVSPKDAQMYEIRRWAIERVASVYGVPLGMVGLDDNLKDAQSQFYADVLPPYCEEMTKMLSQRILARVYNETEYCFEFNLDEKHMGDDRLAALVSAAGGPILLRDEARAMVNRPPIPGGGTIITPLNVTVGGKPSPQVMPVQDPNKPAQDGSHREEPKALRWADHLTDATIAGMVPFGEELAKAGELLHPTLKSEHERQLRHIDAFHGITAKHFGRLSRSLRNKADSTDWARWDREFGEDLHKELDRIVETEGDLYALKLAGDFDPRLVKNYVRAMAEGAAEGINAKVRDEITELGLEQALARFAQHVESSAAGLGAGVTRFAREEAAKQAPHPQNRVKTWVPNTARHAQFGGNTVPLGANWPAGFAPGSAPGCKCSMSIY